MSDLPCRYPISISHIDIESYLVTLRAGRRRRRRQPALPRCGAADLGRDHRPGRGGQSRRRVTRRGLRPSTSQLNLSRF
jgi:hypothetical protein